jgi:hypothetical protein
MTESTYSKKPDGYVKKAIADSIVDDISFAMKRVEELGADPRLTDVVFFLSEAKQRLGDWVKNEPRRPFKASWE